MNNYEISDKSNILKFIQDNFKSSDLIAFDVQLATGIHERKVSAVLKEYVQMSFKQYVNYLKIEHAKRLLNVTDMTVSDIAYECGYNNIAHFQKVFRDLEAVSVSEYRVREKEAVIV